MVEELILLNQIDLVQTIISKSKNFGTKEQPITMSIFIGILEEVKTEKTNKLVNL